MAIVEVGRTADAVARASKLAFLVDADEYFRAFADAMMQARRWIGVLAWDVDSRVRLGPGGWPYPGVPDTLAAFLDAVVRRRDELCAHILSWAPSAIYALERETFVRMKLGWATCARIRFELDDSHATTACHHQKVVVVDDALALAGGIDLTSHRWDTPAHAPNDPRRVTTRGKPYGAFHDVQVMAAGPIARAMGALVRERWRRHTGEPIEPPPVARELWPERFAPDAVDVDVGLVTTDPERGARSTEALHLAAIESARASIYIENQYLTSTTLTSALAARLMERDGPEVVIVAPRRCSGWLEESTMGVLRRGVLAQLAGADRHGRLRAAYPLSHGHEVFVHSKVLVVDGELAYAGSANWTDRSMGFDTECGIAVEAAGRDDVRRAISGFRDRLLAEHLGLPRAYVRASLARGTPLCTFIDEHNAGEHRLAPLEDLGGRLPANEWAQTLVPRGRALVDPPEPMELVHVITEVLERRENGNGAGALVDERRGAGWRARALQAIPLVALVLAVLALWRFTPVGTLTPADVRAWLTGWRASPLSFPVVVGAYALGALCLAPLNLLTVPTVLAFGPGLGFLYALAGSLVSASLSYLIGRVVGGRALSRLGGAAVQEAAARLQGSGILAVAVVRLLPVAPYPIVNLVAGAIRLRFPAFFGGTALGLLPGLVVLAALGGSFWKLVENGPGTTVLAVAIATLLAALALVWALRFAWRKRAVEAFADGS